MRLIIGSKLSVAAIFLAFAGPIAAQDTAVAPAAPVTQVATVGPPLWQIADKDTTIYLFGTVHALPKDVEWFKGDVAQALSRSDSLVTEVFTQLGGEEAMRREFRAAGMLPPGKNLREMLSEEERAMFESALTGLGLPVNAFDRFEPWMAAVNLSIIPLLKAGYSGASGVETVLEREAAGKERGALETAQFQIDMLDNLPMDTQKSYLLEVSREVDKVVPLLNDVVAEWADGDIDGLGELLDQERSDPALTETIFYARNRDWAEWIETRLDRPGTVFVAVGAGHLAGGRSVQAALAERDIAVMRLQ